jgi:lysylphosphatidylglycerol synthetase-like protein (DUF2156 family)
MSEFLHRFSLHSAKFNTQVVLFALLIWLVVVACAVTSILGQPFSKRQRLFWLAVVIFLPLVGVLAYLPFSFRREELPHAFLMKKDRPKQQRGERKNPSLPPGGRSK